MGNGAVKETEPRVRRVLQDYWKTGTGNNYSEAQVGNPAFQNAHPWSAAFISWVMKTAGAGNAFRYSSAHATYTKWAKDNRLANNANPFKAYRITELSIVAAGWPGVRPQVVGHRVVGLEHEQAGDPAVIISVAPDLRVRTTRTRPALSSTFRWCPTVRFGVSSALADSVILSARSRRSVMILPRKGSASARSCCGSSTTRTSSRS